VIHSVLSPGVQIGNSAKVHNSILLHNVWVGAGARIQNAILDENVRVAEGVNIGDDVNRDREYGLITENSIVVIPANTCVAYSEAFSPPRVKWKTEMIVGDQCRSRRSSEMKKDNRVFHDEKRHNS
jgi:NDP-sugar pyrophosphorylase family protein